MNKLIEGSIYTCINHSSGQPSWLKGKCIYKKVEYGKHKGLLAFHKINGKNTDYWFMIAEVMVLVEMPKYKQLDIFEILGA